MFLISCSSATDQVPIITTAWRNILLALFFRRLRCLSSKKASCPSKKECSMAAQSILYNSQALLLRWQSAHRAVSSNMRRDSMQIAILGHARPFNLIKQYQLSVQPCNEFVITERKQMCWVSFLRQTDRQTDGWPCRRCRGWCAGERVCLSFWLCVCLKWSWRQYLSSFLWLCPLIQPQECWVIRLRFWFLLLQAEPTSSPQLDPTHPPNQSYLWMPTFFLQCNFMDVEVKVLNARTVPNLTQKYGPVNCI